MDTWNEKQLKSMNVGGNKNLQDFFQDYDLNDEAMSTKYKTRAAEYYRLKVITNNHRHHQYLVEEHLRRNHLPE
jgi:hypothetical protein